MLSTLQDGSRLVMYGTLCDVKVNAGQPDGDAVCRTARSDTVRLQASFDEAALSGDMKIYATDGKAILVSAHFKHGQPDGEVKQLVGSTGKSLRIVHWDEGKLEGETKIWYPQTGDLTYSANYRQGTLNGDFFSLAGIHGEKPLVTRGTYENGKFTGTKPASFGNDEYRYDIHVDAKYTDDVIQNRDDVDRMNQFGHQVVDCVHRTAYSVAKAHDRTYLTTDEETQLVAQCKIQVAGASNENKDKDSSVVTAVNGGSDAATVYLTSVQSDQNGQAELPHTAAMNDAAYKEAFICALSGLKDGSIHASEGTDGIVASCIGNSHDPSKQEIWLSRKQWHTGIRSSTHRSEFIRGFSDFCWPAISASQRGAVY